MKSGAVDSVEDTNSTSPIDDVLASRTLNLTGVVLEDVAGIALTGSIDDLAEERTSEAEAGGISSLTSRAGVLTDSIFDDLSTGAAAGVAQVDLIARADTTEAIQQESTCDSAAVDAGPSRIVAEPRSTLADGPRGNLVGPAACNTDLVGIDVAVGADSADAVNATQAIEALAGV